MREINCSNTGIGWPSQTWLPKVAVVTPAVAVAAVAAVAGLAKLVATIPISHLCGVKQLFKYFFCFFLSLTFLKVQFSPYVRPPWTGSAATATKKKIIFCLQFFCIVFLLDHGASVLSVFPSTMCIFFKWCCPTSQLTSSATSAYPALSQRVQSSQ